MVDHLKRVVLISFVFFMLFECTVQQQFLISRQERLALLQLRSSLGLRAREWPVRSNPCTNWTGVQCTTSGSVTGITISGFRRTRAGNLNPQFSVDALQNLPSLSLFNASHFALPGSIPQWFGSQLSSLQVLDLRSCLINGAIPSSLGNLNSLVQLYLSDNNLTGIIPSSIGQLSRVFDLDLSRNSLTGSIPVSVSGLRNLTRLDMSVNFFSGDIPSSIGNLSRLQYLNLSRNSLSSSIPVQLGDLSTLVEFDIGFNSLSGSIPSNLFPSSTQLQFVDLSHNALSGNFPNALWSIASLRFLDVSVNNFTGTLPNNSPTNTRPTAATLNISENSFYGNLASVITQFSLFDISGNYFEGPVPSSVSGNSSLSRNCLQALPNQRNLTDCVSFYSERNLRFDNFGRPNSDQSPASSTRGNRNRVIILASVFGGVGIILLVVCILVALFLYRRKRGTTSQRSNEVGPIPPSGSPSSLEIVKVGEDFTHQQILQAADEFNDMNLMKNGHSGDLFRGTIEGGVRVVIKRIDLNSSVKKEAYMSELNFFGKISHPRFVPLLGHGSENENQKFLVYKHMPNEDLSSSLFKKSNLVDDSLQSLDWITRLKIAIGAAEGLSYLHHECTPPLVHRDVQASSILLDDKFEVRLSSVSRVTAQEGDAHQKKIARFLRLPQTSDQGSSGTPNATCAYDVYCFGKVLLELVTGKLGISSSADPKEYLEATLPHISIYDKELITKILDPSLIVDEDLLEEVWAMAIVARSCLNPKPSRRPLIRYVLKALENPLKVVREESTSSRRLRTMSSRGSWNAALFGSWRHSSSDVAHSHKAEGTSSFKQMGNSGSQGSGRNGDGIVYSSSKRHSKEIFPEPLDEVDVERGDKH